MLFFIASCSLFYFTFRTFLFPLFFFLFRLSFCNGNPSMFVVSRHRVVPLFLSLLFFPEFPGESRCKWLSQMILTSLRNFNFLASDKFVGVDGDNKELNRYSSLLVKIVFESFLQSIATLPMNLLYKLFLGWRKFVVPCLDSSHIDNFQGPF